MGKGYSITWYTGPHGRCTVDGPVQDPSKSPHNAAMCWPQFCELRSFLFQDIDTRGSLTVERRRCLGMDFDLEVLHATRLISHGRRR